MHRIKIPQQKFCAKKAGEAYVRRGAYLWDTMAYEAEERQKAGKAWEH